MPYISSINKQVQVPFWKMDLSSDEIVTLKKVICEAYAHYAFDRYPIESAILFSEWWRNDYDGGFPSKERVAAYIGIDQTNKEELFKSAKKLLNLHFESFRSLGQHISTRLFKI